MKKIALFSVVFAACEPSTAIPEPMCPGQMEPHEAIAELAQLSEDIEMIRRDGVVPLELIARAAGLARCVRGDQ
jgi:hypothetical protein